MAQVTRKNSYSEQLWNVSLLPTPASTARRSNDLPQGPGPGGGSALRLPALLSDSAYEQLALLVEAA